MGLSQLPRDSPIERRVVFLSLLVERQRRRLESEQDVAEIQLRERANRLRSVAHPRFITGISPVTLSGFSVVSSTCTTMAVMLSSPPRPFASEISA